jgi:hypothetical protein
MRTPRLILATLAATGCTLLLNFDPEGQPCGPGSACLGGYGCTPQHICSKGFDAGPSDACGGCPAGQRCLPVSKQCVPNTCANKKCPVGYSCVSDGGSLGCVGVAAGQVGSSCSNTAQCISPLVCWLGPILVRQPALTQQAGSCVLPCSGPTGTCAGDGGLTCQAFPIGLDAGAAYLCLPPDLIWPCVNDAQCTDDGLTCTTYDEPSIGAGNVCDLPAPGGVSPASACSPFDGGPLCANGLCLPHLPPAGPDARCGELCDQGTCPAGQFCREVEVDLQDRRFVPMCLSAASACTSCAAGSDAGPCGPDAPACSALDGGIVCLADCADGGMVCPPSTLCDAVSHFCVPVGGTCP